MIDYQDVKLSMINKFNHTYDSDSYSANPSWMKECFPDFKVNINWDKFDGSNAEKVLSITNEEQLKNHQFLFNGFSWIVTGIVIH